MLSIFENLNWLIYGGLIGLTVPLLLFIDNKQFGISSSFRHILTVLIPQKCKGQFFDYPIKEHIWNLFFALGVILGGFLAYYFFPSEQIIIETSTIESLKQLGLTDFTGLYPKEIFNLTQLMSWNSFIFLLVGGLLVGFGTRYADGCTSGHAIMGMSLLAPSSFIAVIGFFIGGLIMTHLLLPLLIQI